MCVLNYFKIIPWQSLLIVCIMYAWMKAECRLAAFIGGTYGRALFSATKNFFNKFILLTILGEIFLMFA